MTVHAEQARAALAARLTQGAYEHCVAVAEAASRLASAYDVDPDEAYLAGLLHDWSREEGPEALLASAGELGLAVSEVDRKVPYLLHARVGAARVREAFPGLSEPVVTAIEHHTTGAPGMSALAMVVYLADMIEPSRDHPGVGELRRAVGSVPLAELYARGYAASLRSLLERRKQLHPESVGAWNAIVEGGEGS